MINKSYNGFQNCNSIFSRKNVKYFNISANVKMILLNSPVLNIDHVPLKQGYNGENSWSPLSWSFQFSKRE